ncbi:hypothetical protein [Lactobacillus sp.]|uniref:hypothetical protein n=1 Tax=Lactobacillus sp. TaxID=1591 RepID=UPI0019AE9213|nr:hypothetical protein [Lactobacillus sp.]MBD5430492.1 hypothetical protein [Lactobacillus sp.]MBD5430786.1 hypothetical protein [Lactobacillus sp.]
MDEYTRWINKIKQQDKVDNKNGLPISLNFRINDKLKTKLLSVSKESKINYSVFCRAAVKRLKLTNFSTDYDDLIKREASAEKNVRIKFSVDQQLNDDFTLTSVYLRTDKQRAISLMLYLLLKEYDEVANTKNK